MISWHAIFEYTYYQHVCLHRQSLKLDFIQYDSDAICLLLEFPAGWMTSDVSATGRAATWGLFAEEVSRDDFTWLAVPCLVLRICLLDRDRLGWKQSGQKSVRFAADIFSVSKILMLLDVPHWLHIITSCYNLTGCHFWGFILLDVCSCVSPRCAVSILEMCDEFSLATR